MKEGCYSPEFEDGKAERRTFPTGKTILLVLILVIQIAILFGAFSYDPQPQDVIRQYDVTVWPQENGSLDIQYHFVWEAVDPVEPLTWIEIGMANENYVIYPDSVSDTISRFSAENEDGYVYLMLFLDRAYSGGEVLEFSFKVNQKDMLCLDNTGYFYEFVPGWFNTTPVEQYTFRWAADEKTQSASGAQLRDGYYVWSGSFECGGYEMMNVRCDADSFMGCDTVRHYPFDDSGTYNSLAEDKAGVVVLAFILVIILIVAQVWTVDSVVSYHRGRGFLTGYGHHVHIYGRSNPHYIRARDKYNAAHAGRSGGHSGGGCACACACACAGGGRAGCSQKDTYASSAVKTEN